MANCGIHELNGYNSQMKEMGINYTLKIHAITAHSNFCIIQYKSTTRDAISLVRATMVLDFCISNIKL